MKNFIKYTKIILGLFLAAGLVSSCTKKYEEINTNPNNPVDVPAINIFTNAVQAGISRQMGGWMQHTYVGCWCQQWCKVQYIDEDRYMPRDMSGEFQAVYISELKNLTIVINKAHDSGDKSLEGAAKVMRAWAFMYLTDCWGDIPYSEALQGFSVDGTLTPKYDKQADIYADLLTQLEDANQLLSSSTINFGSGDIIYGGDPVKWRKFANSLKLRLLTRCAGTPWTFIYTMAGTQPPVTTTPGAAALATADAQIATILGNSTQYPIFDSNDDNAMLVYPGLPYRNPIYNTLLSRQDQAISETMVNWLKSRSDPRLYIYAMPTPVSQTTPPLNWVGFQNGRGVTAAPFPSISMLGTKIACTETAPVYVMTYDEVLFHVAEYQMRKGADAAAKAAYEAGIAASMERWGLADGSTAYPTWGRGTITTSTTGYPVDYAAYLAGPLVAWGGTDAQKYQKICEQRWAAIFGEGIQAYAEVRRTGFPERAFEYELEATYYPGLGLPIRLTYPLS
ncbi:MAG: SusD/RagB family nutrient-binding outer membrane lipoprotein, partial [Bacteroidota bacterium]|nr:SusD/RagB family nutrient-binding outer membrane lipoprotein [Bacteroidota bacterium]